MNDVLDQIPELEEPLQLTGSPDDDDDEANVFSEEGDDEEVFYDPDEYEELNLYGDPSDDFDFDEDDDDFDEYDEDDDDDEDDDLDELFGAPDEDDEYEDVEFYFEDELTGEEPEEDAILTGSPADYFPDDDDTIILDENQVFRHLDGVGLVAVDVDDLDDDDDDDFDEEIETDPLTGAPRVRRKRRSRKKRVNANRRNRRKTTRKRKAVRARNRRSGQRVTRTAKAKGNNRTRKVRRRKAATRRAAVAAKRSGGVRVVSNKMGGRKRNARLNRRRAKARTGVKPRARKATHSVQRIRRKARAAGKSPAGTSPRRRQGDTRGMTTKQRIYNQRRKQWKQFAKKKKIDQMTDNPRQRALLKNSVAKQKARRLQGINRRLNNPAFTEQEKVMLRTLKQEATSGKKIPSVKRQTILRTLRAIRKRRENAIVQNDPNASAKHKAFSKRITSRAVKKFQETKKPDFKKKIYSMIKRQKTTLYKSYQPFTATNKAKMVRQADHFARAAIGRAAERGQTETVEVKSYVAKRIADGADMTPTPTLNVHYNPGEDKPDISKWYPGLMESLGVPQIPIRAEEAVPLPAISPSVPLSPPPLPRIPTAPGRPLVSVVDRVTVPPPTLPAKPVPSVTIPTPVYPNTVTTPPTNAIGPAIAVAVAVDKVAAAKTTKVSVAAANVVRFIQTI